MHDFYESGYRVVIVELDVIYFDINENRYEAQADSRSVLIPHRSMYVDEIEENTKFVSHHFEHPPFADEFLGI